MSAKTFLAILTLATALTLTACQTASGNLYGYDFQTARMTYQISGSSEGKSDVLIKGEKKYIHNQTTQKKVSGEVSTVDVIQILDGNKLYVLDPKTKTGSSIIQPGYAELQNMTPDARRQKLTVDAIRDTRSAEDQQKSPLQPAKTEVVAGQTCADYINGNFETCLWQAIPLKTIASLPDYGIQTTTVATNIELNQPIDDSEFAVPADYKITELN